MQNVDEKINGKRKRKDIKGRGKSEQELAEF